MKRIAFVVLLLCAAGCVTNKLQRSRLPSYNPPIPPGVCTNCPPGDTNQYYMQGVATNKFLVGTNLAILGSTISSNNVTLAITNTVANVDYMVLSSSNLLYWYQRFYGTAHSNSMLASFGETNFFQFYMVKQDGIIIYSGTPETNQDHVNYVLSIEDGWGWVPVSNSPTYKATDITRTNTTVVYLGKFGDTGNGTNSVTISPVSSPNYRFSIYFNSTNIPTQQYPLYLKGFRWP